MWCNGSTCVAPYLKENSCIRPFLRECVNEPRLRNVVLLRSLWGAVILYGFALLKWHNAEVKDWIDVAKTTNSNHSNNQAKPNNTEKIHKLPDIVRTIGLDAPTGIDLLDRMVIRYVSLSGSSYPHFLGRMLPRRQGPTGCFTAHFRGENTGFVPYPSRAIYWLFPCCLSIFPLERWEANWLTHLFPCKIPAKSSNLPWKKLQKKRFPNRRIQVLMSHEFFRIFRLFLFYILLFIPFHHWLRSFQCKWH